MNTTFTPPLTQEEECKRALAKIYALLLALADDIENLATDSETNSDKQENTSATSEPLKKNIPS